MDKLTIIIADDHPLFRKGLRSLVASMPNAQLIGEAANGIDVVILAEKLQPDVILMDLQMPGGGGLPAIREILQTSPHIRILVVTMFQDDDSVFAAMRAGARGYVLKDMDDTGIERAILTIASGEAIFSPAIASRMISFFGSRPNLPIEVFPDLTETERNVLKRMAQGLNNDAISRCLSLASKTVRNYVSNIYLKLQVADRSQAIIKAHEGGLKWQCRIRIDGAARYVARMVGADASNSSLDLHGCALHEGA